MTDVAILLAAAEVSPVDAAPKLVLADALDEAGNHNLAHAYRWAGRRGKCPQWNLRSPISFSESASPYWGWLSDQICRPGVDDYCTLPAYFFKMAAFCQERGGYWVQNSAVYNSFAAAFEALAVALAVLRDAYSEWPSGEPSVR